MLVAVGNRDFLNEGNNSRVIFIHQTFAEGLRSTRYGGYSGKQGECGWGHRADVPAGETDSNREAHK